MKIVCFGEALIDFKATGPLAFQGFVGGSPLNVTLAAARLGTPVALGAGVSRDAFGDAIMTHLEQNGVSQQLVTRHDAPSTLAFVSESGGDVDFTFIGEGAADTRYDPQPRPTLPASVAFLEFGSISLLREPGASAVQEVVAAHRERCAVIFDPNIRPALIPDRAAYLPRLEAALQLSHLVKVSAQDLRWLYPDTEPLAAAATWLERGPEAVIVTRGDAGTTLLRTQGQLTVPVPRVEVVDTVGAGDTFMGALMVRLDRAGPRTRLQHASRRRVARRAGLCRGGGGAELHQAGGRPTHQGRTSSVLPASVEPRC